MSDNVSNYIDVEVSVFDNPDLLTSTSFEALDKGTYLHVVNNYYNELVKAHSGLPPRAAIDLKKISNCLEYVFLLETSGKSCPNNCPYFYRVVGTELRDLFGAEMSRTCIEEKPNGNIASHMKALFKQVQGSKKSTLFAGQVARARGAGSHNQLALMGQILLLPFSNDGLEVSHIMGVMKF